MRRQTARGLPTAAAAQTATGRRDDVVGTRAALMMGRRDSVQEGNSNVRCGNERLQNMDSDASSGHSRPKSSLQTVHHTSSAWFPRTSETPSRAWLAWFRDTKVQLCSVWETLETGIRSHRGGGVEGDHGGPLHARHSFFSFFPNLSSENRATPKGYFFATNV